MATAHLLLSRDGQPVAGYQLGHTLRVEGQELVIVHHLPVNNDNDIEEL